MKIIFITIILTIFAIVNFYLGVNNEDQNKSGVFNYWVSGFVTGVLIMILINYYNAI